jgi:hypothetical protein
MAGQDSCTEAKRKHSIGSAPLRRTAEHFVVDVLIPIFAGVPLELVRHAAAQIDDTLKILAPSNTLIELTAENEMPRLKAIRRPRKTLRGRKVIRGGGSKAGSHNLLLSRRQFARDPAGHLPAPVRRAAAFLIICALEELCRAQGQVPRNRLRSAAHLLSVTARFYRIQDLERLCHSRSSLQKLIKMIDERKRPADTE